MGSTVSAAAAMIVLLATAAAASLPSSPPPSSSPAAPVSGVQPPTTRIMLDPDLPARLAARLMLTRSQREVIQQRDAPRYQYQQPMIGNEGEESANMSDKEYLEAVQRHQLQLQTQLQQSNQNAPVQYSPIEQLIGEAIASRSSTSSPSQASGLSLGQEAMRSDKRSDRDLPSSLDDPESMADDKNNGNQYNVGGESKLNDERAVLLLEELSTLELGNLVNNIRRQHVGGTQLDGASGSSATSGESNSASSASSRLRGRAAFLMPVSSGVAKPNQLVPGANYQLLAMGLDRGSNFPKRTNNRHLPCYFNAISCF